MPIVPTIEILEARIAPAALLPNNAGVSYTDIDGDHVVVTFTGHILTSAMVANQVFSFANGTGNIASPVDGSVATPEYLTKIDLTAPASLPAGFGITVSVTKAVGGDGLANVGYIKATGRDVGTIKIKGDLGQIDAGSQNALIPAIKALSVRSMGRLGLDSQNGAGDLESTIRGALGSLSVTGDVKDAYINVNGAASATIGPVTIGGSLIGGTAAFSGQINGDGGIGAVKIGHDLQGGSGATSGAIVNGGPLVSVTIGGSVLGASGNESAEISSDGDIGAIKIGHDVLGGTGAGSAFIASQSGAIASITIGGSLIGGANDESGGISANTDLGPLKIGHNLQGGSITGSNTISMSGAIESVTGRIASVKIGGSIISGIDDSSGILSLNASIHAATDLGALTVGGSIIGNVTAKGASPVIITAVGQAHPGLTTNVAIGKITVGGRVENAEILGGYDRNPFPVNGDAQIGAVTIGGDWIASDLVAGVKKGASGFGVGDLTIGAGTAVISKITSVKIAGQVFGTPRNVSPVDSFGFVAEQIGAFSIGGSAVVLQPGPHTDLVPIGISATGDVFSDVFIHEI